MTGFKRQLDAMHKGFVAGVFATLKYQLDDIGVKVTHSQMCTAARTVLKAQGWSENTIEYWIRRSGNETLLCKIPKPTHPWN